jgi:hypothetical protein
MRACPKYSQLMRAWILLSGFGLGVVGALLLLSFASVYGDLAAMAWGFVVFPHGWAYVACHGPRRGPGSDDQDFGDASTRYWRTTDWHSAHR